MQKMAHSVYNIRNRAEKEFYSRYNPMSHAYLNLTLYHSKIFWNYIIINVYKISLDNKSDFLITHHKLRTILSEIRDYVVNMKKGAENFYIKTNLKMNPKLTTLDNKLLLYF
jgi:hypothetical protein